jgi:hypothetical protein
MANYTGIDGFGSVIVTGAAVLTTGQTVFTVAGGPIRIVDLISYCTLANGVGAQTLKWTADGSAAGQAATDICAASGDLASFAAGGIMYCNFTTLATAPVITQTAGVALYGPTASTGGGVIIPAGILLTTYTGGPSTGTWQHYMRWLPLAAGVSVTAAF